MEACLAVEREEDKVLKKLRTLSGSASEKLQKIIEQVNDLKDQIEAGSVVSPQHCQAVKECAKSVKETCQGISTEHKDVHAAISKFGRAIDKNFQSDISGMCVEGVFSGDRGRQLNMVICEHLFRQGKLDVGERVIQVIIAPNETVNCWIPLSKIVTIECQQFCLSGGGAEH